MMPGQQTSGQRSSRRQRQAGRSGACGLALLALAAAGCGELHFVASPYTAKNVELIYSAQEDITVVRWRVTGDLPLTGAQFELLGPDGYRPIAFTQSVYTGGLIECSDGIGTCAQYVVRGHYQVMDGARPIQAVHDVYGVLPGGKPTKKTVLETLRFDSFFRIRNDMVFLNFTIDTVSREPPYVFPRRFERAMWPTAGLCVSDTAPDGVSFLPLDDTGGFPPETPLTEEGMYCVGTRPIPTDGGPATLLQKRIATQPELVNGSFYYMPPIEYSPVIYQIILDLEIPVADRCTQVIQEIESLTQKYYAGGLVSVPVHKLPTINLATDGTSQCAQNNGRTVRAVEMSQAIKQLVTTLTGEHQQVHLLYFNNLDGPLPMQFVSSLDTLFDALAGPFPGYKLQVYSWIFAPPGASFPAPQHSWWAYWIWQTTDESFEMKLESYQLENLPRTSQMHDATKPVPFLSDAEVAAYEGKRIKLCSPGSPPVTPVAATPFIHPIADTTWIVTAADPPAFTVTLPNQETVQSMHFVPAAVGVSYQICTRYCVDHGYVTTNSLGAESWVDSRSCGVEN